MCKNSRTSLKRISVSLLLLLLLASPCFAAGRWFAISGLREAPSDSQSQSLPQQEEQLEQVAEVETVATTPTTEEEASSQTPSTQPYEIREDQIYEKLESLLSEYEKESMNYENQSSDLMNALTTLDGKLQSLEKTEAISEAEYSTVKSTMVEALSANKEQADRIAKLENEAKSKAYAKVNAVVGFEEKVPTWGLGGAIGVRLGDSLMIETGADYMFGTFSQMPSFDWDIDNLRITTGIGWMF